MAFSLPDLMGRLQLQLGRGYRQFRDVLRTDGIAGYTRKMRSVVSEWLQPKEPILPVRREDVLLADLSHPTQRKVVVPAPDEKIILNWVTTPAGPGSGGHTTLFRLVRYLESHGYINRIYFYDVYRGDHRYYAEIARSYYGFHGPVNKVEDGMEDAHAVVATAWPTAYPVFNSKCTGKRFYLVQDFEPSFHPTGSLSLLAENTYRMGFHAITAGRWLAQKLSTEYGMEAESFDFGCDISQYCRLENSKRSGVVFYARPEAARRGFELGAMALEAFAIRQPEIEIHFYGEKMGKMPFRFIDHGRVSPERLNQIYNRCFAGLSLSLTNVSLVPHEMLAAGCIPVVNDAVQNRIVLNNPYVCYAQPTPAALASELEALVTMPAFDTLSRAAAASVHGSSWEAAGATVDEIIRRAVPQQSQLSTRYPGQLVTTP
jgi:O-antigen biosynthesis protein